MSKYHISRDSNSLVARKGTVLHGILYYIMVSNEYYQNENGPTQLGPAVNLLGYHRLLLEQLPFGSAAVHDYGMSTEITKQEAIHRGIVLF